MSHGAFFSTLVFVAATLGCEAFVFADTGPQPPCGNESFPSYPDLDHAPVVTVWDRSDLGRDWTPPACTGWSAPGFSSLIVTVARFRDTSGMDGVLRHVGAISQLTGMRYWSTTHKRWQALIVDASALAGPAGDRRREDFASREISEGGTLYFQQNDNLTGKATYSMHVGSVSPDRLVFETENINTIRYFLVPLFRPGELQSIYFLEQESPGVWRYFNIARTAKNANTLVAGHDASSINRAVAFFRHWAGIPTDQEPPAAR
jgi:hypothetical protein